MVEKEVCVQFFSPMTMGCICGMTEGTAQAAKNNWFSAPPKKLVHHRLMLNRRLWGGGRVEGSRVGAEGGSRGRDM